MILDLDKFGEIAPWDLGFDIAFRLMGNDLDLFDMTYGEFVV